MRALPVLPAALLAAVALGVAACGSDDSSSDKTATPAAKSTQAPSGQIVKNPDNAKVALKIGSKSFTEQRVLGQIYAQGLAAAGYKTSTDLNLADEQTALKALKGGQIDAYPEYTGTALLSFFNKKASDLPSDPQKAYEEAKADFAKEGITAFPPTPFTDSNEVAVTKATADKLGLKNISDLSKHDQDLVLYGTPECRQRMDCLLGLEKIYGLKFKKFVPVVADKRHEVLQNGKADVSIVFTTDPQIKRNGEILLEDDKGMFPPYNSMLLAKDATAEKAGADLPKTIDMLQKPLTDDAMQELDARVDLDKKEPAEVAKEYLQETGLVK
jgi:osmoprotectant transport system substrate-binding protein